MKSAANVSQQSDAETNGCVGSSQRMFEKSSAGNRSSSRDANYHYQIESAGSVALVFECPITQFTEAVKEYGPAEGVLLLALVETDIAMTTQLVVLQPLKGE